MTTKSTTQFRVVTVNVNGIRAAARRGGLDWLHRVKADVICLQEVRATHAQLHEPPTALGHFGPSTVAAAESSPSELATTWTTTPAPLQSPRCSNAASG